jgi:hypothetical protein
MVVAIVAAIAAIAGTLVGAFVTYEGDRQLQDRELAQEEARQTTAARAIARLLMTEYQVDAERLYYMASSGHYEPAAYREHTFVSRMDDEDRKLLAGHLSEHDWLAVSAAARENEVVQADLEAHQGTGTTGPYEHDTIEKAEADCSAAFRDLEPLAEGRSSS